MLSDLIARQNGTPPPAVTITILPHPSGQQISISHALEGGWQAVQQLLLRALHIAVQQEVRESAQKPPPLITQASLLPRFRQERG